MDALTTHLATGRRRLVAAVSTILLALLLSLTLLTGTAVAVEDAPGEGSRRPAVAETSRDQLGLVLLGVLGAITIGGAITANRQLKGRRPQATGEFRWR